MSGKETPPKSISRSRGWRNLTMASQHPNR
jgi:hypothetical protein